MWNTRIVFVLVLNVFLFDISAGYKVLLVFPLPGKSHGILGEGYVRHLLNAGHEVTYITPIPIKNNNERFHQIDVSSNFDVFPKHIMSIKVIMDKEFDFNDRSRMFTIMNDVVNNTLMHPDVQNFMFDVEQNFDVVITEWLMSELYSGFAAVFNCPLIWSSSLDPHFMMLKLIDEPTNPAYVASFDSTQQPPFTFFQRVKQLFIQSFISVLRWTYSSFEGELYEKAFGPAAAKRGLNLPEYEELKYNVSFILGNSHAPLSPPIRLPKNYKEIGGYHIETEVKPLPEKLQKIMDNAKNGVIYFSMGSNLRSKDMPDELKRDLLKMFGQLKQTVLWKFEEDLPNLPNNVHILNWAPQASILAHPKCVLFITHGGLLSTSETVHYGVPIIGIPVFADQFTNVDRAVNKGFAKKVDLTYDLAYDLKVAIEDILNNPGYRQRVKEISTLFHDRRLSPGAELVYWVEHVARTRGAPHLRSPALIVPWYQKMYLDLLALMLIIVIVIFRAIKYLLCLRTKRIVKKKKD